MVATCDNGEAECVGEAPPPTFVVAKAGVVGVESMAGEDDIATCGCVGGLRAARIDDDDKLRQSAAPIGRQSNDKKTI